jgi:hypothetical protein
MNKSEENIVLAAFRELQRRGVKPQEIARLAIRELGTPSDLDYEVVQSMELRDLGERTRDRIWEDLVDQARASIQDCIEEGRDPVETADSFAGCFHSITKQRDVMYAAPAYMKDRAADGLPSREYEQTRSWRVERIANLLWQEQFDLRDD